MKEIKKTLMTEYNFNDYLATKLSEQLNDEALRLAESDLKPVPKAIRVNSLKKGAKETISRLTKKGFSFKKIDYLKWGFQVVKEPISPTLGSTNEYLFGYYFIQSPISMLIVESLDPQPGEIILDIAAGVGGKTTYISQLMMNKGVVVAVEPKRDRVFALRSNISRMGCENVIVLQMDGRNVLKLNILFDKVLLDAPCTGSGLFSKYPELKTRITEADVIELQNLQKQLFEVAFRVLKRGGTLVYSTCSVLKEEGEDVVSHGIKLGAHIKPIDSSNQIIQNSESPWLKGALRFFHHKQGTEGFFVCRVEKT